MLSLIIPVYNRPQEVEDLLRSLTRQTNKDFEVIIIEDGSAITCLDQVNKYQHDMTIQYKVIPNSGPSKARNTGAKLANGDYLIVLDSDVILPEQYIEEVYKGIDTTHSDAFGGPDAASNDFTPIQKAINYSMTGFFTTGGIRGGKKKLDKFYPRSFNLGCKRDVFDKLNGFSEDMRFGEDIDFSLRLFEMGCKVSLFPNAYVFHKRRVDFKKFFKQVHNSGIARVNLELRHPGSTKLVHLLPSVFTVGLIAILILSIFFPILLIFPAIYMLLLLIDSTIKNKSLIIGILSIPAAFIQLTGYGTGYIEAWWKRHILKRPEYSRFNKTFYK
ncbi:glycosyltransferase [Falsiporphyromonas endometrii]|uniref:Glycosyltransferase n=1 Tax=Falsiporphyromonas endometrii TaxID=1387297 RepID=A0ABV9K8B6_9PORP